MTDNETSIKAYLSDLMAQEGLYVGLGLGMVAGGLLATRDLKDTLNKAFGLLTLIEQVRTELEGTR